MVKSKPYRIYICGGKNPDFWILTIYVPNFKNLKFSISNFKIQNLGNFVYNIK